MEFVIKGVGLRSWLAVACTAHSGLAAVELDAYRLAPAVAAAKSNLIGAAVTHTGVARGDYLKVIAGVVNYFRHFQTNDGRIIDPFQHKEIQYSTPCYAWAATALIL